MIREVLFMLSGKPGAVFVLDREMNFEICPGVPGLTPSERQLLKPLLKLGSAYRTVATFISDTSSENLYVSATKTGIGKCLRSYEKELAEIEHCIIYDGKQLLGVTGIYSRLLQFELLLGTLTDLVSDIKDKKLGSGVLDVISRHKSVGIGSAIGALDCIWNECSNVLKKQLISWLLFGKLLDPHDEFFIKQGGNSNLGSSGKTSYNSHTIDTGVLPVSVMSIQQAQKALFIGESTIILRESANVQTDQNSLLAVIREMPTLGFEELVEIVGKQVTGKLWELVTAGNKLHQELSALHSILLMKRGEIFSQFVIQASPLLDNLVPPETSGQFRTLQFGIQQKFKSALNSCTFSLEDDSVVTNFAVNLASVPAGTGANNGWNRISLDYKVTWPLDVLIFTADVLKSYNEIFRLLLKLRRVRMKLQELRTVKDADDSRIPGLRWSLQHIFTHLSQYLQTDVIEVQKSLMEKSLKNCTDFEQFRTAHALFLSTVISQTFIHVPAMQDCIQSLMELGCKFCDLSQIFILKRRNERPEEEMTSVSEELQHQIQLFFTLLNAMYRHSPAPVLAPLAQLLLRLDYNHFFSKVLP